MSSALSFCSEQLPLSDRARNELIRVFRRTAREKELSPARTDRYQAWTCVFLHWCLTSPHRPVKPEQIEPFRRALREAGRGDQDIQEAMDALGFLFGALSGSDVLSTLSRSAHSMAGTVENEKQTTKGRSERPRTLEVGWHDRERVLEAFPSGKALWEWMDSA